MISNNFEEVEKINYYLYNFMASMHRKLFFKAVDENFRGWDDPGNVEKFEIRLREMGLRACQYDFTEEDIINMANFCMFLWYHKKQEKDIKEASNDA